MGIPAATVPMPSVNANGSEFIGSMAKLLHKWVLTYKTPHVKILSAYKIHCCLGNYNLILPKSHLPLIWVHCPWLLMYPVMSIILLENVCCQLVRGKVYLCPAKRSHHKVQPPHLLNKTGLLVEIPAWQPAHTIATSSGTHCCCLPTGCWYMHVHTLSHTHTYTRHTCAHTHTQTQRQRIHDFGWTFRKGVSLQRCQHMVLCGPLIKLSCIPAPPRMLGSEYVTLTTASTCTEYMYSS